MNASRKTRIIAQGIALWAEVQDTAPQSEEARMPTAAWEQWAQEYPQFARFVCDEQFALFDKVNARF